MKGILLSAEADLPLVASFLLLVEAWLLLVEAPLPFNVSHLPMVEACRSFLAFGLSLVEDNYDLLERASFVSKAVSNVVSIATCHSSYRGSTSTNFRNFGITPPLFPQL